MVFQRFYNEKLAQASYLVGCGRTGEAIVIDPLRDPGPYLEAARAKRLRITAVTETHIHADYLSGVQELAAVTGAKMYLSDEGGPDWQYEFRNDPSVTSIKDGDTIRVGNVRLDVVHTPGHTPEHVTFILTDEPASQTALGAFTGDFVFVGDVGRPDLLERAANIKGTMEAGGRQLFSSVKSFSNKPDGLLIWPGHGAGSACGKNLGGAPVSSLGYEKVSNWAFRVEGEDAFVREVLSGQPEPPHYFATMKRMNRQGPPILGEQEPTARIEAQDLLSRKSSGAQVVDLRPSEETISGFIEGSLSIPNDEELLKWSGWFLNYEDPILLIARDQAEADQVRRELALIGLDRVEGWTGHEVFASAELARVAPCSLAESLKEGTSLLDVRSGSEYAEGHIPGVIHVPIGYLSTRMAELPRDGRLAIHCASGSRARIASVYLRGHGFCSVCNVPDDFDEYSNMGLPIEVGSRQVEPV
jgi:hydroxyacylglutathione hydrolase